MWYPAGNPIVGGPLTMWPGMDEGEAHSRSNWPHERVNGALRVTVALAALPAPVGRTCRALPAPSLGGGLPVAPGDPAALAVRSALAADLVRLRQNEPAARRFDPEGVHQLRAAVRRLRSDLRTFRPLLDRDWAAEPAARLRDLADTLGAVRDLDVLQVRLERDAIDLPVGVLGPLRETFDRRRAEACAALASHLDSAAYRDLVAWLDQAARDPRLHPAADAPCRSTLPALAAAAWRKLRRAVRRLRRDAPEARFHRVRILAKRARYAAEAVAPSLAPASGSGRVAVCSPRRAIARRTRSAPGRRDGPDVDRAGRRRPLRGLRLPRRGSSVARPTATRREGGSQAVPRRLVEARPQEGPSLAAACRIVARRSGPGIVAIQRVLVTPTCWHIGRSGHVEHFGGAPPVQWNLPKGTSRSLISTQ